MKSAETKRRSLLVLSLAAGLGWAATGAASERERPPAREPAAEAEARVLTPGCGFRFTCDAGAAASACGTDKVQTLIDCLPSVGDGPTSYVGCVAVAIAPQVAWCIADRCVDLKCHL